jgi:hypothetical protein
MYIIYIDMLLKIESIQTRYVEKLHGNLESDDDDVKKVVFHPR